MSDRDTVLFLMLIALVALGTLGRWWSWSARLRAARAVLQTPTAKGDAAIRRAVAVGLGKDLAHVTIAHPNTSTTIALVYGELDDVELLCEVERMVRDTLPAAIHFRIDHAVTTPWCDVRESAEGK